MQAWRLGSYELVRSLGEGGMAQVYLARDVRLGREVAVKVLDQRLGERPGFRERFLREARVAAALDHPNIVPLYDFGESEQLLYLVMPFVSGGSLQDMLARAPLPVGEVVTYGAQMADALDYAHQRHVVHRDVKPANMLVHADGRLLLSDFGLAKILASGARPTVSRGHPDAGTPEYMAPEQVEGRTDERSDIYALGVVLYLLLTGHLPFSGSSSNAVMEAHLYRLPQEPRLLNPSITPAMQAVVMRALAKRADDRFQRASELGAALLGALVAGDAEPLPFSLGSAAPPGDLPPLAGLGAPVNSPLSGMARTPRLSGSLRGGQISGVAPLPPNADSIGSRPGTHPLSGGVFTPAAPRSTLGRMPAANDTSRPVSRATVSRVTSAPVRTPPEASMPSRSSGSMPVPLPPRRVGRFRAGAPRLRQRLWVLAAVALMLAMLCAGLVLRWLQSHPADNVPHTTHAGRIAAVAAPAAPPRLAAFAQAARQA